MAVPAPGPSVARRAARTTASSSLVPLAEQDRGRWDTRLIAEGVELLQAALARDHTLGLL